MRSLKPGIDVGCMRLFRMGGGFGADKRREVGVSRGGMGVGGESRVACFGLWGAVQRGADVEGDGAKKWWMRLLNYNTNYGRISSRNVYRMLARARGVRRLIRAWRVRQSSPKTDS
jgi:hypothetical protein